MIVISKKRVQIILIGLLISIFAFSFQVATNKPDMMKQQNIVETSATPVSGKTIVLDARSWNP